MKKTILNLSLIAIITLLFSSCGSISITQKRYSNGLNIDWFAGKDKKDNNQKVAISRKSKSKPSNTIDQNEQLVISEFKKNVESNSPLYREETAKINELNNEAIITINKNKETNKSLKSIKKTIRKDIKSTNINKPISIKNKNFSENKSNKTNESGLPLLLMIILAIIIPPLAVYLYYREFNIHFWISLILLLFVGGGLYSSAGIFGLGFAAIHALLVVLGVFN